jgi:hypothetical protein
MVFKGRMEISLTYGSQFYNSREKTKDTGADATLLTPELAEVIHRGCVSRYSMVHEWRKMKPEKFDEI